ncbi:hypothetical protein BNATCHR375 (nucleomorph) [Bigelowiella natans]|uniref:Uncharacterized protein n=1 Tax=Bigelowiella natans TaxID=227086 RepID=Q3LVX1_BIGNA|nr:hypothetical protein BNATCHR375 [Bigelowiella natans]ABA27394.1 hypothetical protein [Bigelowiella natans]
MFCKTCNNLLSISLLKKCHITCFFCGIQSRIVAKKNIILEKSYISQNHNIRNLHTENKSIISSNQKCSFCDGKIFIVNENILPSNRIIVLKCASCKIYLCQKVGLTK